MSTVVMSACWPLQIPPVAKAVLISLADNANDAGYCWPSIDTICDRTCYGRTAVIEAIKWLETAGHVVADRSNGRKTTYRITVTNQSATRTGTPREPVRQTDSTSPPRGLNQSATRTLTVKNHQEPSVGASRSPTGSRLNIETLPKDWRDFCAKDRPDLDPDAVFVRFVDYWKAQPGAKGRKLDWMATWRNWVRDQRVTPRLVAATEDKPWAGAI